MVRVIRRGAGGVLSLYRIDLTVPQGSLLAVVGQVGAGKSSLLSALLGDLEKMDGCVTMKVNFSLSICF